MYDYSRHMMAMTRASVRESGRPQEYHASYRRR
jgi:hypothetical protein